MAYFFVFSQPIEKKCRFFALTRLEKVQQSGLQLIRETWVSRHHGTIPEDPRTSQHCGTEGFKGGVKLAIDVYFTSPGVYGPCRAGSLKNTRDHSRKSNKAAFSIVNN